MNKEATVSQNDKSTRDQALSLARKYLQTKGYNGFSFQDIADDLKIKKASLHYYFVSKDEMIMELLKSYEDSYYSWTEANKSKSPEQKLKSMIQLYVTLSEKSQKICPVGALCADFLSLSSRAQESLVAFHSKQRDWIKSTLSEGIKVGSFKKIRSVSVEADQLITLILGGLQVARMRQESKSFEHMLKTKVQSLLV